MDILKNKRIFEELEAQDRIIHLEGPTFVKIKIKAQEVLRVGEEQYDVEEILRLLAHRITEQNKRIEELKAKNIELVKIAAFERHRYEVKSKEMKKLRSDADKIRTHGFRSKLKLNTVTMRDVENAFKELRAHAKELYDMNETLKAELLYRHSVIVMDD